MRTSPMPLVVIFVIKFLAAITTISYSSDQAVVFTKSYSCCPAVNVPFLWRSQHPMHPCGHFCSQICGSDYSKITARIKLKYSFNTNYVLLQWKSPFHNACFSLCPQVAVFVPVSSSNHSQIISWIKLAVLLLLAYSENHFLKPLQVTRS